MEIRFSVINLYINEIKYFIDIFFFALFVSRTKVMKVNTIQPENSAVAGHAWENCHFFIVEETFL